MNKKREWVDYHFIPLLKVLEYLISENTVKPTP